MRPRKGKTPDRLENITRTTTTAGGRVGDGATLRRNLNDKRRTSLKWMLREVWTPMRRELPFRLTRPG